MQLAPDSKATTLIYIFFLIVRIHEIFLFFSSPLGDSVSDETETTSDLDSLSQDLEEEPSGEVTSPTMELENELSESISNQIPLQRIAMSVRKKRHRGSKILKAGWMIHYNNKDKTVS